MASKTPVAIFIAASAVLASVTLQTSTGLAGEEDLGGLREWTTDQGVDEQSIPDEETKKAEEKAEEEDYCIPIGEGENCW